MSMSRRGFLGAMMGAMAAPAIVRAESLMKIVVPKQPVILLYPHQQAIIDAIRDTVHNMYTESGFKPSAPSIILCTDPRAAEYLRTVKGYNTKAIPKMFEFRS